MIRDEIRRAWEENPRRVIASTIATLLAVPVIWAALVVYIVGMQP